MIDPKTIELMNHVLDGAATEPERAELERALTSSPEARNHYESLGRLVRRLDSVPLSEPPADLHPRLMAAVESVGARPAIWTRDEPGFFGWLHRALGPSGLRYASTFGLGLAAGAILLAVVRPSGPIDPNQVAGTLATPVVTQGFLPVSSPGAGVAGSVAVLGKGPVTQVSLQIEGDDAVWVFDVPERAEAAQSVVIRVVKSGETVFEGAVQPVQP